MITQTQVSAGRGLTLQNLYGEGLFEDAGEADSFFLDQVIPLANVSHAEIVRYSIEIPMRYAECFAVLANGERIALANRQQFKGWSDQYTQSSLLFVSNSLLIELCIDAADPIGRRAPGRVSSVRHLPEGGDAELNGHRFIACDGSLMQSPLM